MAAALLLFANAREARGHIRAAHRRGEAPQDGPLPSTGPLAASALFKIQREPPKRPSLLSFNDGDNLEKYHTEEEVFNFAALVRDLDVGNLSGSQQASRGSYSLHIWMYSDELQGISDKP